MEATPISQLSEDSGCISGSFSTSSIYRSTPTDGPTPNTCFPSRKRKFGQMNLNVRKLQDVIESCPSTPQCSSTLNESLVNNLEKFHLKSNCSFEDSVVIKTPSIDFSRSRPAFSALSTPEKKVESKDDSKKLKGGLYNLKFIEESPVKEAQDILYANIRTNVFRRAFSPAKFRESLEKLASPAKKCLFTSSERLKNFKLFSAVVSNPVIMSSIFLHLSDGDLYRASLASAGFKQAIFQNFDARQRYEIFMEVHRENKENYKVTPPNSPEKNDSPPGSPSRFNEYVNLGKQLGEKQSLVKCPRCAKPSLLDNSIGQCQNLNCGYIYCQKCFSFSETGPEDFYDRCQSSALGRNHNRSSLSDMSNNGRSSSRYRIDESSRFCSIFHSPRSRRNSEDSSGFVSETDFSPKPFKRNLIQKLKSVRPDTKVFHLYNDVVSNSTSRKISPTLSAVPVIPLNNNRIQDFEPPSPPKVRSVACSKQSKRNLKRLTR